MLDYLTHDTHSVETIHKVLLHNPLLIADGRQVRVTVVRHEEGEEVLELCEFCI